VTQFCVEEAVMLRSEHQRSRAAEAISALTGDEATGPAAVAQSEHEALMREFRGQ
jgi:hypothetical protein